MSQLDLIIFNAGEKLPAPSLNTNFAILAGMFNAGIDSSCLAAAANIRGSQLSVTPGQRLGNGNLENACVDARVLAADAQAGSAGAGVGSAAHIKDGIITSPKYADRSVTKAKVALSSDTGGGLTTAQMALTFHSVVFSTGNSSGPTYTTVNPTTPFPKANYDLLYVYLSDITTVNSCIVDVEALDSSGTGGANWAARVMTGSLLAASGGVAGLSSARCNFVFLARA